ncbi:MAG TPA: hypothetical protein VGK91_06430 [Candidatus Udaeobacter sp.]|jgi:hypothetical protein
MNESGSKIEIFKPFGEAFELMKKMLFQPFEFRKWLVIGFAAWLANFGAGGAGIGDFNSPNNRREVAQKFNERIGQIPQSALITGVCILICVVLLLIVLFAWLRARGRFMFVDCVVRNCAAIAEPWKEFRAEENNFFLFSLLAIACAHRCDRHCRSGIHRAVHSTGRSGATWSHILDWPVALRICCGLPCFRLGSDHSTDVPIMYRQRCRARLAFAQAVDPVRSHPGPILLYVLFLLL